MIQEIANKHKLTAKKFHDALLSGNWDKAEQYFPPDLLPLNPSEKLRIALDWNLSCRFLNASGIEERSTDTAAKLNGKDALLVNIFIYQKEDIQISSHDIISIYEFWQWDGNKWYVAPTALGTVELSTDMHVK